MFFCSGRVLIVFRLIGYLLTLAKIAIPLLLIIMAIFDFLKAVTVGNNEVIKKAQKSFLMRTISGIFIFFIPTIVLFILSLVSQTESSCLSCVLDTNTCNVEETINQNNESAIENNQNNYVGYCTQFKNEKDCKNECVWTKMSNFGDQFNNPSTNDYFCAFK